MTDAEIREAVTPVAVVQFAASAEVRLGIYRPGLLPMRFLVVDERCPGDRVFEVTATLSREELASLIGDAPIGRAGDGSDQDAAAALIRHYSGAAVRPRPMFRVIEGGRA
jgi:hypothetical protein